MKAGSEQLAQSAWPKFKDDEHFHPTHLEATVLLVVAQWCSSLKTLDLLAWLALWWFELMALCGGVTSHLLPLAPAHKQFESM